MLIDYAFFKDSLNSFSKESWELELKKWLLSSELRWIAAEMTDTPWHEASLVSHPVATHWAEVSAHTLSFLHTIPTWPTSKYLHNWKIQNYKISVLFCEFTKAR